MHGQQNIKIRTYLLQMFCCWLSLCHLLVQNLLQLTWKQ